MLNILDFFRDRKGHLLQVMIALCVMGALSYHFWADWQVNMTSVGTSTKTRIETDSWLQ